MKKIRFDSFPSRNYNTSKEAYSIYLQIYIQATLYGFVIKLESGKTSPERATLMLGGYARDAATSTFYKHSYKDVHTSISIWI